MQRSRPRSKQDSDRKRSRSPRTSPHHRIAQRLRSKSPKRHDHGRRRHQRTEPAQQLPFDAHPLNKHDFRQYHDLFAEYLEIQKRLDIWELDEDELKGRWKSFLGKWNRGELAEGWYEPGRAEKASEQAQQSAVQELVETPLKEPVARGRENAEDRESEPEDIGPIPLHARPTALGPSIPSFQDLQYRQEAAQEDRELRKADRKYERKLDRRAQKERLEDLVPRAEPGTRERQLENKREVTASNRAFASNKEGGDVEVGDRDLMGGDDGADEYKRKLKLRDKVKTEREIKKEEALRARAAEREEKLQVLRDKEEKTMAGLRELARARFG